MGKTYKKVPSSQMRRPKGNKQARISEARNKSIPPSAWEDISHDDHCFSPEKAAERMADRGFNIEKITKKLKRKFNLTHSIAEEIAESVVK